MTLRATQCGNGRGQGLWVFSSAGTWKPPSPRKHDPLTIWPAAAQTSQCFRSLANQHRTVKNKVWKFLTLFGMKRLRWLAQRSRKNMWTYGRIIENYNDVIWEGYRLNGETVWSVLILLAKIGQASQAWVANPPWLASPLQPPRSTASLCQFSQYDGRMLDQFLLPEAEPTLLRWTSAQQVRKLHFPICG